MGNGSRRGERRCLNEWLLKGDSQNYTNKCNLVLIASTKGPEEPPLLSAAIQKGVGDDEFTAYFPRVIIEI